jgi:hypothetical protein
MVPVRIRPLNVRTSHGFFGSVVEIVAERRADLRLGLDCREKFLVANDKQVPLLRGPEETRQFVPFLAEHTLLRNPDCAY